MTAQTGEGFPRAARIRSRREFLALGRSGQTRRLAHLVVIVQRREGPSRLGLTVSRKIGGAVTRNRLKRRIREMFRRGRSERLFRDQDVVVIARPGSGSLRT